MPLYVAVQQYQQDRFALVYVKGLLQCTNNQPALPIPMTSGSELPGFRSVRGWKKAVTIPAEK
jgi:hypothetical protein